MSPVNPPREDLEVLLSYLQHFKYMDEDRIKRLRNFILREDIPAQSLERFFRNHPDTVGVCPCGCTKYSNADKAIGMKYCVICGEEITWKR